MNYDDLSGLDMYDDGMGEIYSVDMLKGALIAAGASASAIVVGTLVLPKLTASEMLSKYEPTTRSRIAAVLSIGAGLVLGRLALPYNRDAAMAIVGGLGGLGIAQLADSFLDRDLLHGTPLGALNADQEYADQELSDGDEALLSAYDEDSGSALAALESSNVHAARGAFSGFEGPQVSQEALMGLDAAVVQGETLGVYNPYLA
jgi:hypothetical protein